MDSVSLLVGDQNSRRFGSKFPVMGGSGEILVEGIGEDLAAVALPHVISRINELEARYSRYRQDSLISSINNAAGKHPVEIDAETYYLFRIATHGYQLSNGKFDLTAGVLRRAWDFRNARFPEANEVEALLPLIGWDKVQLQQESIFLPEVGMELDLGGIVKEYAVDFGCALLLHLGCSHALVNLGGDIGVTGPRSDGTPWQIGIKQPDAPTKAGSVVSLKSGALATSGDYERSFMIDGVRYAHLLDPTTGYPVRDSFRSVSVIRDVRSGDCVVAGLLATIAHLLGREQGARFLNTEDLWWQGI